MLRLDLRLVTHRLNVKEGTRLLKQVLRNFRPKLKVQIDKKIKSS